MLNSITPRVGSIFHLRGLKPLDLVLLQFFEELPSLPSITWIMLCCIPVIPVTLKSTTWCSWYIYNANASRLSPLFTKRRYVGIKLSRSPSDDESTIQGLVFQTLASLKAS